MVADTSINKTVSPVELPDTVQPVNYKLWFRPNAGLSTFDGRADVEIKMLKSVNQIVIAGHRIKFCEWQDHAATGQHATHRHAARRGRFLPVPPVSSQIPAGNYSVHMEWQGIINFKTYDDPATKTGGSCGDDPYPGCSAAEGVFRVDLKSTDGSTSGAILTQGETNLAPVVPRLG